MPQPAAKRPSTQEAVIIHKYFLIIAYLCVLTTKCKKIQTLRRYALRGSGVLPRSQKKSYWPVYFPAKRMVPVLDSVIR